MKLMFLGTGAADWPLKRPPEMTEYRRLSSALIDRTLLIDPGPQVLDALEDYGIDRSEIKYIINTHKHGDHYKEETLTALRAAGAEWVEFTGKDNKTLGNYTVYSYIANHGTATDGVHFLIKDGEKTLFYGLDGAWLLYDEVRGIKEHKPDLAVLDGTVGFKDGDHRIFEHNNLHMVLEMKKTLAPYIRRFCISHMARTLHTDHATLAAAMEEEGIVTAYDGLILEV